MASTSSLLGAEDRADLGVDVVAAGGARPAGGGHQQDARGGQAVGGGQAWQAEEQLAPDAAAPEEAAAPRSRSRSSGRNWKPRTLPIGDSGANGS